MTTPEKLAQVLCESAPVTELYSGEDWSDLHPVEQGHWIEMARAVLAHLDWDDHADCSGVLIRTRLLAAETLAKFREENDALRAQAAAHGEDVRKIRERMVKIVEALRKLYDISYHVASEISLTPGHDPVADRHFADWRAALDTAEALLAEADGR